MSWREFAPRQGGAERVRLAPVTFEQDRYEQLPTEELYDLAVGHAVRHLDIRFLWRLLERLPAAEAAAGELDEAAADVLTLRSRVDDLTDAGRGEVGEMLRPFYLEYLRSRD
jgi:hypothetical protein